MLSISETVAWGILYYSFGVLLRPFASHLQASEASIAGAFSGAILASAATAWVAGASIDRWGPRPVMTLGALLGVGAFASLASVDTLAAFYVAWALIGVSQAAVLYEPAFAAIAKWFSDPNERSRALLSVTLVAGFASTIFVPLTAALYERFGHERSVLLLALVALVTVVPLNAALPRHHAAAKPGREPTPAARASTHASDGFPVLAAVFSLQAFASAGVTVHLVTHLRENGFELTAAAAVTGLLGAAQVPARLLYQTFQRLLGARARLPVLLGVQALSLVGVLATAHPVAIASALVFGAANGLMTLERAVVIADVFGTERYGAVSGRVATVANAARAAAPLAVGLLKTMAASYAIPFLGLAVLTAVAGAMAWAWARDGFAAQKTTV